jgi:hypothetical protein
MPIDPAGTKPGLKHNVPEPKRHNMRCRNSSNCDSMEVVEINANTPGRRIYRCVKCNVTWGVPVGGSVDFG